MQHESSWQAFLKNADERSLQELFLATYSNLYAYGLKLSGDTEIARDAVQNVFVNLWQYRGKLNSQSQGLPYLIKSVRNETLRLRKKMFRFTDIDDLHEAIPFLPPEFQDERLDDAEKGWILAVLNELPPRQREILYLRFYEDMEYADIADVTGISYQSVINQSFRAVTKLRQNDQLKKSRFF